MTIPDWVNDIPRAEAGTRICARRSHDHICTREGGHLGAHVAHARRIMEAPVLTVVAWWPNENKHDHRDMVDDLLAELDGL